MIIKHKNKQTNFKSAASTCVATSLLKIIMTIVLYNTLKDMYFVNQYLTIILTIIGLKLISGAYIELEWK